MIMKFYGKPKIWVEDPVSKTVFGKTDDHGLIEVDNPEYVVMIERLISDKKLKLSKKRPKEQPEKKSDNPLDNLEAQLNQKSNPYKGMKKTDLQNMAASLNLEFKKSDSVKVLIEKIEASKKEDKGDEK
jgi:hypothetical protein